MTHIDTEPLKEYIAALVAVVIEKRIEGRKDPASAPMADILAGATADIKAALNELVRSGVLTYHKTLNGVSFEFTPPK